MKHTQRRVVLLIDGSNLYWSAEEAAVQVLYAKLLPFFREEFFGGKVKVCRAFFYHAVDTETIDNESAFRHVLRIGIDAGRAAVSDPPSPQSAEELAAGIWKEVREQEEVAKILSRDRISNFYFTLTNAGYAIKLQPLKISGTLKSGDLDAKIATDLVSFGLEGKYNTIILGSGDGHYASAVSKVLRENMNLELFVLGFPESTSRSLRDTADHFLSLTEDERFRPYVLPRMDRRPRSP